MCRFERILPNHDVAIAGFVFYSSGKAPQTLYQGAAACDTHEAFVAQLADTGSLPVIDTLEAESLHAESLLLPRDVFMPQFNAHYGSAPSVFHFDSDDF